mgnify:CR=1 FL=1
MQNPHCIGIRGHIGNKFAMEFVTCHNEWEILVALMFMFQFLYFFFYDFFVGMTLIHLIVNYVHNWLVLRTLGRHSCKMSDETSNNIATTSLKFDSCNEGTHYVNSVACFTCLSFDVLQSSRVNYLTWQIRYNTLWCIYFTLFYFFKFSIAIFWNFADSIIAFLPHLDCVVVQWLVWLVRNYRIEDPTVLWFTFVHVRSDNICRCKQGFCCPLFSIIVFHGVGSP